MNVKVLIFGLVILIGFFGTSMTINKTEVPKAVKDAFAKKYPAAEKVEWESEESGEEEYEVQFKLNGNEVTAKFSADGSWLETETKIKNSDLPDAITTAIASQFADYKLEKAELLELPDMPAAYEVKLKNEDEDEEVKAVYSEDGKLLSKKVKTENEEEEEGDGEDGDGN